MKIIPLNDPSDPLGTKRLAIEIQKVKETTNKLKNSQLFTGNKVSRSFLFSFTKSAIMLLFACIIFVISMIFIFTSCMPFMSKWQQLVDSVSFIFGNL